MPTSRDNLAGRLRGPWRNPSRKQLWVAAGCGVVIATGFISWQTRAIATKPTGLSRDAIRLRQELDIQTRSSLSLIDRETQDGRQVEPAAALRNELARIRVDIDNGNFVAAADSLGGLRRRLADANSTLDKPKITPTPVPTPTPAPVVSVTTSGLPPIPIIMYHKTPVDFDAQLSRLEQRGYTVVDLTQVASALVGGGGLPAKPAVITFDDGFTNQLNAFSILQRHGMKATFYIINGGEGSGWCIGAGRNDHPHGNCGDDYLSWDQIRMLDRSGLVTIGAHTLDHLCPDSRGLGGLNTIPEDQLRAEVTDSKSGIEAQLGHPIYDFAYPCGNYSSSVVAEVRAAGFRTAVTTTAGTYQSAARIYTLYRLRDTWSLP